MKLATSTATLLATALLALPLAGETGVFFTPMLTAYEQGRVDDARQLAEGYLERARRNLQSAAIQPDQDSALRGALALVESIMDHEGALDPVLRFARRAASDGAVAGSSGHRAGHGPPLDPCDAGGSEILPDASRPGGAVVDRRSGADGGPRPGAAHGGSAGAAVARDWSRARGHRRSAAERCARDAEKSRRGGAAAYTGISAADGDAILAAARVYFDAVVAGDVQKLSAATGLSAARSTAAIERRKQEYRAQRIRSVSRVAVPTMTGAEVAARVKPGADGEYLVAIPGIRIDVVAEDGGTQTRTIDKLLTVRRGAGARWSVVEPN